MTALTHEPLLVHSRHSPIRVVFFRLGSGREPVRDWLRKLDREDRKAVGEDIKILQLQWPMGMPLTRKMEENLWELRSQISSGIARTFFTMYDGKIMLLHGFIKKSNRTPATELAIARRRLRMLRS